MRMVLATMALMAGTADAQGFDPRSLNARIAGRSSEVLVLGTPHLSGLPRTFAPEHLRLLLDRLAAWKPELITIESLSGAECDHLRRYAALHHDAARDYCWDPAPARAATGLDVPAATLEAERLLASWPNKPTAAQRRHLAAVFLAAGDQASALVQWLRLPLAERGAGDGLDQTLASRLNLLQTRRDESFLIAAVLGARLDLERVYATDDHTADSSVSDDPG